MALRWNSYQAYFRGLMATALAKRYCSIIQFLPHLPDLVEVVYKPIAHDANSANAHPH